MLTSLCQRQRRRRTSWRPAGECFDPRGFEVCALPSDRAAKAFVLEHHYAGTYPAARRRFGLYERGALVGVAVYSVPMSAAALRPWGLDTALELGRFVLLDGVRANGETWSLARTLDALRREGWAAVVSLSDPEPRSSAAGELVFAGHVGTIYQASSATYVGRATPRTLRLLPDGSALSARALQKIRAGDRGWRYAVEQLVRAGAPEPRGDLRTWLRDVLPALTRTVRHGGNHRYLLALTRGARADVRRAHGEGLSYPRFELCERRTVACAEGYGLGLRGVA